MTEPWLERWTEGRIGWHEPAGNASLKRYWEFTGGRRVLVPLCGKSVDLLWLESRGDAVVGVELSEIAVRDFFAENGLEVRVTDGGRRYRAVDRDIAIYCGDYFDFDDDGFDAHYDRGALVAMPAGERRRYAAHTNGRLTADAAQLVITLEYDQSVVDGPPYAVFGKEVLGYWPSLERVAAYDDIANGPPKFRDAGLDEMIEVVWRSSSG